jgi:hypothetical protein
MVLTVTVCAAASFWLSMNTLSSAPASFSRFRAPWMPATLPATPPTLPTKISAVALLKTLVVTPVPNTLTKPGPVPRWRFTAVVSW